MMIRIQDCLINSEYVMAVTLHDKRLVFSMSDSREIYVDHETPESAQAMLDTISDAFRAKQGRLSK